jgi:hypothetical protein
MAHTVISWRRADGEARGSLIEVPSPWSTAIVAVCQKCVRSPETVDVLRAAKSLGRKAPERHAVRVTESGCLDVCPTKGIAMAVMVNGSPARCVVAESVGAVRQLAELWS